MNLRNHGVIEGRFSHLKVCDNKDGSRKILATLMVKDNYASRDGERKTHPIPVQIFVSANNKSKVYDMLEVGLLIGASYELKPNNYMKNGEMVYDGIIVAIKDIDIKESKTVVEARRARKAAENNTAAPTDDEPYVPIPEEEVSDLAALMEDDELPFDSAE